MARNLCELLYCNVLTDIKLESPNYIHQAISLQVIYCIVRVVPTPSSEQRSCARKSILKEGNFGVFALGWCCFKNQKVVVKFSLGEKALFELWYSRTLGSCAVSSVGTRVTLTPTVTLTQSTLSHSTASNMAASGDGASKKLKLVVFGATGRTGNEVVKQALEKGHHVTAVVRTPEKMNTQ